MKRKQFLTSLLPLFSTLGAIAESSSILNAESDFKTPSRLKPGDTIGIACPAGAISLEEIKPALLQIESWGYRVKIGQTIGKRDFNFGGTDTERLADFQQMLDDPNIKAILCGRGGYGSIRIIDKLRFDKFVLNPKWIIGFSDVTVMHSHLSRNHKIASIHSKMCNSFPENWDMADPIQQDCIISIKKCLAGEKMRYEAMANLRNREGICRGHLLGGNLKTIESLAGTRSDMDTRGAILFLEDTGEYLYGLDRMFWNLKRSGKLDHLKGLIIGGFNIKSDDPGEEFGKSLEDIVLEKVKEFKYPVCFNFPVGHQLANYALQCGVQHILKVSADSVLLQLV